MKTLSIFILLFGFTGVAHASLKKEYRNTKAALSRILGVERADLTADQNLGADAFQMLSSINREYAEMGIPRFNPYAAKAKILDIEGCYSTALHGANTYAKVTPSCLAKAILQSR